MADSIYSLAFVAAELMKRLNAADEYIKYLENKNDGDIRVAQVVGSIEASLRVSIDNVQGTRIEESDRYDRGKRNGSVEGLEKAIEIVKNYAIS